MRPPTVATAEIAPEIQPMLGEVRALAEQAGTAAGAWGWEAPTLPSVANVPSLRTFAEHYALETVARREWPAVLAAWQFARAGHARELIALDRAWTAEHSRTGFAEPSFRVGRRQLNQLRPLRHERVVQHYLAAIEAGEARGWHPLVYGVTLAVFNLPLRQGLLNYANQTLAGLVGAAEARHALPVAECRALLDSLGTALLERLPPLPGLSFAHP
jgi:urease accessory protein UreF